MHRYFNDNGFIIQVAKVRSTAASVFSEANQIILGLQFLESAHVYDVCRSLKCSTYITTTSRRGLKPTTLSPIRRYVCFRAYPFLAWERFHLCLGICVGLSLLFCSSGMPSAITDGTSWTKSVITNIWTDGEVRTLTVLYTNNPDFNLEGLKKQLYLGTQISKTAARAPRQHSKNDIKGRLTQNCCEATRDSEKNQLHDVMHSLIFSRCHSGHVHREESLAVFCAVFPEKPADQDAPLAK